MPLRKAARAASPLYQIKSSCVPIYLTHGENDEAVEFSHSVRMAEKARKLLGDENVVTEFYKDAPHASKAVFDSPHAINVLWKFITEHFEIG